MDDTSASGAALGRRQIPIAPRRDAYRGAPRRVLVGCPQRTRVCDAGALGIGVEHAPAVVADGLTKRYGAVTAVDNLSFEVRPAAVTGFLGPNGAGKTTTLRMVLGLARPTSGRATILGRPYTQLT